MTLDQEEEGHCKQVIEGMVQAEASVQRELRAYRAPPPGFDKEACKQVLAKHMQAFLARLAELCDMMEDNQNKRGVAIIKHTVLVLEYLCDPKYTLQTTLFSCVSCGVVCRVNRWLSQVEQGRQLQHHVGAF